MNAPNRETWLLKSLPKLAKLFIQADYTVPEVRVSIGWPSRSATSSKSRRIGECWSDTAATDHVHHIFLSPVLVADGPARILDVLVHEIVHAVVGLENKHNAVFKKCATAVGLTGKMTATTATPELAETLKNIADALGPFPGGGLNPATATREKQTTRMRKYTCPQCSQIVRAASDSLDIRCNQCECDYVQEA